MVGTSPMAVAAAVAAVVAGGNSGAAAWGGEERNGEYKLKSFWYESNEYPRAPIYRFSMGLGRAQAQGEHWFQVHHCDSVIIPIDDQIGPIYTVYKTVHYDVKTIFRTAPVSFKDSQTSPSLASRGLTTFVTPKPQFRTNPSDHGKASSNIAL
ncbi:hypothetical protein F511_43363 [Dorcoceras hygrometricum]|uniref:Uncharacterized protein n=1 Tax=Dorcoceras hygrometricum TaxID=472368 RepID=A0A2Z7CWC2_9LAMI|nr:hypothetical protein F511_43363 [Dorcoceras hygrometricum]